MINLAQIIGVDKGRLIKRLIVFFPEQPRVVP
jgi:hypothetical protein